MLPLGSAFWSSAPSSAAVVSVLAGSSAAVVWVLAGSSALVSVLSSTALVSVLWSVLESVLESLDCSATVVAVAESGDSWAPAAAPAPAKAAATSTASTPETHGARKPERRGGRNEDTMAPSLSGVVEVRGCGGVAGDGYRTVSQPCISCWWYLQ